MRYRALACDYDGTIATEGAVSERTVDALRRLGRSGRRLLLVTGRELGDLERAFPHLELFDRVVAENGAVLYRPADRSTRLLADPPPPRFVEALRARGVTPLATGAVVVATWEPNEAAVLETIRELGLELQVSFNKGAVMVLPGGVTKATGLRAALDELGLSPHNVVGVGDAENDHAFLDLCAVSVAVANALPSLKERCDLTTRGARGAGVEELVGQLLQDDLASLAPLLARYDLSLGRADGGEEVRFPPLGTNLLISGPSGSGKSTLVTALLERLAAGCYQFCVIDPEGDYATLPQAIHLGDATRAPRAAEALGVLEDPGGNVAVNLLGVRLDDRPGFFEELLGGLKRLRRHTGRPHRIVVDEAHHMLSATWQPADPTLLEGLDGLVLIAAHPEHVSPAALAAVDLVVATSKGAAGTFQGFCQAAGYALPALPGGPASADRYVAWYPRQGRDPVAFRAEPSSAERRRHVRKYAEGTLGEDKSFYFRGPDGRLNLRAQNLQIFVQLAEGVDDATWLHHLRRGEYSRWLREAVKDPDLAEEVGEVEREPDPDPAATRERVRAAIERRYTAAP